MANNATSNNTQYSGYFGIVAWTIIILLFILISKFKIGYIILTFFTLASILIVLAVGSPTIVKIFNNAAIKPGATK